MKNKKDSILVKKVKKGDIHAYETLVNKHMQSVYTIALRIVKNNEDAEETAQDVFMKVYKSIHSFKGDSKFSTWLYRITYNLAISKTRKKKTELVNIDETIVSDSEVFETYEDISKIEKTEKNIILKKAINKLKEDEAIIITLYYLKENSIEEISEITNFTKSNVKIKLFRARKKLFTLLRKSKEAVIAQ